MHTVCLQLWIWFCQIMIQNRSIKQNKEKAWSYLNWVQPAPREGRQNAALTNSLEPDGCTDCSSSGWDPFFFYQQWQFTLVIVSVMSKLKKIKIKILKSDASNTNKYQSDNLPWGWDEALTLQWHMSMQRSHCWRQQPKGSSFHK